MEGRFAIFNDYRGVVKEFFTNLEILNEKSVGWTVDAIFIEDSKGDFEPKRIPWANIHFPGDVDNVYKNKVLCHFKRGGNPWSVLQGTITLMNGENVIEKFCFCSLN